MEGGARGVKEVGEGQSWHMERRKSWSTASHLVPPPHPGQAKGCIVSGRSMSKSEVLLMHRSLEHGNDQKSGCVAE